MTQLWHCWKIHCEWIHVFIFAGAFFYCHITGGGEHHHFETTLRLSASITSIWILNDSNPHPFCESRSDEWSSYIPTSSKPPPKIQLSQKGYPPCLTCLSVLNVISTHTQDVLVGLILHLLAFESLFPQLLLHLFGLHCLGPITVRSIENSTIQWIFVGIYITYTHNFGVQNGKIATSIITINHDTHIVKRWVEALHIAK